MSNKKSLVIKPGEFWSEQEIENEYNEILRNVKKSKKPKKEKKIVLKPETSDSLVLQYQFFQKIFGAPNRVFYPCCRLDISAKKGFLDSKVTFLDKDQKIVKILRKNGIDAICMDVKVYEPIHPFDLLIILNPQVSTKYLVRTLRNNGLIIANNYHHNTREMLKSPKRYTFLGLIDNQSNPLTLVNRKGAEKILSEYCDYFSIFKRI